MKTRKRNQLLIVLLTFTSMTVMSGCSDKSGEMNFEIAANAQNAVIQKEINGIEFKFYLMNEKGEPATVFNQGENFSFYFSVTNKTKDNLYFDTNFISPTFFRVFSSDKQDFGSSFQMLTALDIGVAAFPFDVNQTYSFQESWIDTRTTSWGWLQGSYKSVLKDPLPKGNYYTEFKHLFSFYRTQGDSKLTTDTLNFKINFKIQ
jgi:hypothetical protein